MTYSKNPTVSQKLHAMTERAERAEAERDRVRKPHVLLRVARDALDRIYDNGDMTGSDLKLLGDIIDRIDQELDQTFPIKIPT